MKSLQSVFWFFYKCLAFYTLIVFALTYWVPSSNWIFGFMMLSFPVAVGLNVVSIFFWLLVKPARAVLPVMLSLLSLLFLPRTYAFGKSDSPEEHIAGKRFKVMNYNVSSFSPSATREGRSEEVLKMREWIAARQADILCLPEYTHREANKTYNMSGFFRSNGFVYQRLFRKDRSGKDYQGLVILSKYPILSSSDTTFESQNGMIEADIRIGRDTARVIAVHLYSMTLKLYTLVGQKEMSGIKRESRNTFSRIKTGFIQRGMEWDVLGNWITRSPHPVIVCGDFNDTPYSYVYGQARKLLTNSFEKKGSGFGYTYNHLPYFIRIDHQFYDESSLELVDFKTDKSVRFSDHYPVMATYAFK